MSMKDIDNKNATSTRTHKQQCVYKTQVQHGAQATMCTQYMNKNQVAIVLEKARTPTLVRLIMFDNKRARKTGNELRIQSALCEVACEEYSRGLKIVIVKM